MAESPGFDDLLRKALARRLAISTLAQNDTSSARWLLEGKSPHVWGVGPEVHIGDVILIYFPKGLTRDKSLKDLGPQRHGLRFLSLVTRPSTPSTGEIPWRNTVELPSVMDLENPVTPDKIGSDPVLSNWSPPKVNFRNVGTLKEPVDAEYAEALWRMILAENPEAEKFVVDLPEAESHGGTDGSEAEETTEVGETMGELLESLRFPLRPGDEYAMLLAASISRDPAEITPITLLASFLSVQGRDIPSDTADFFLRWLRSNSQQRPDPQDPRGVQVARLLNLSGPLEEPYVQFDSDIAMKRRLSNGDLVKSILQQAVKIQSVVSSGTLKTRHILASLLTGDFGSPTVEAYLKDLSFNVPQLKRDFLAFLHEQHEKDDLGAWRRLLEEDRFELKNRPTRDVWTTKDDLGYKLYAEAIANPILYKYVRAPLTIGIQAPWGQGKTSLMRMIQEMLDPGSSQRPEREPVRTVQGAVQTTYKQFQSMLSDLGGQEEDGLPSVGKALKRAHRQLFRREQVDKKEEQAGAKAEHAREKGKKGSEASKAMIELSLEGAQRRKEPDKMLGRVPTVWFNPLYYREREQIWAGLAHAMLSQLADRLADTTCKERFWLKLQFARINFTALRDDIRKAVFTRALQRLGLIGITLAIAIVILPILAIAASNGWIAFGGLAPLAGIVGRLWNLGRQVQDSSLGTDLEKYVTQPDYGSRLGFLHLVDHDIDKALQLLVGDNPIAVFIDDLDRCDPDTVAEVVLAMNQFLSLPSRNVFFFVGMDMNMVARALEESTTLPALYEEEAHYRSNGWRFMQKFVQLPFMIPHLDLPGAQAFASKHLESDVEEKEEVPTVKEKEEEEEKPFPKPKVWTPEEQDALKRVEQATSSDEVQAAVRENKAVSTSEEFQREGQAAASRAMTKIMKDPGTEEAKEIAKTAIGFLEQNPRAIKRCFNLVRVLRNIQVSREESTRGANYDRTIVFRTAVLLMHWPQFAHWVQVNPTFVSAAGKRKNMVEWIEESVGGSEITLDAWMNKILEVERVPGYGILGDSELLNFLRKISKDPPGLKEMYKARLF